MTKRIFFAHMLFSHQCDILKAFCCLFTASSSMMESSYIDMVMTDLGHYRSLELSYFDLIGMCLACDVWQACQFNGLMLIGGISVYVWCLNATGVCDRGFVIGIEISFIFCCAHLISALNWHNDVSSGCVKTCPMTSSCHHRVNLMDLFWVKTRVCTFDVWTQNATGVW